MPEDNEVENAGVRRVEIEGGQWATIWTKVHHSPPVTILVEWTGGGDDVEYKVRNHRAPLRRRAAVRVALPEGACTLRLYNGAPDPPNVARVQFLRWPGLP